MGMGISGLCVRGLGRVRLCKPVGISTFIEKLFEREQLATPRRLLRDARYVLEVSKNLMHPHPNQTTQNA